MVGTVVLALGWAVIRSRHGPEGSPIRADEHVVFFETAARLDERAGRWVLPIHGWIHEPTTSKVRKAAIAAFLKTKYELRVTASTRANFERRVNLFLVDNERGKRLRIRLGDREHVLPPSGPSGHFEGRVELSAEEAAKFARDGGISYRAVLSEGDERRFTGTVRLLEPEGVSVISDIDDTIKITRVTDTSRMLDHTFFQDFQATPGMPELYRRWAEEGAAFHLVSSSPWQLYEPLREFTGKAGFPPATFDLLLVRLQDSSVANLFKSGVEKKLPPIERHLESYPRRRFVLVGDSGEQDPELYAKVFHKYPGRIARIYIRNVSGVSADDERFRQAFEGLPRESWKLFSDPKDLELPPPAQPAPPAK